VTPPDRQQFLEIVLGFAELKGKKLSAPALELYWRAMRDWSLAEFRDAAEQLLRTCEFMPVPADFERLRKAGQATPGEAWAEVLEHCTGPYRCGTGIDDGGPIDQAVAALGGYRAIAMHNSEFLHVFERRFAEHYKSGIDVASVREAVPHIASDSRSRIRHGGLHKRLGAIADSSPRECEHDAGSNETTVGAV